MVHEVDVELRTRDKILEELHDNLAHSKSCMKQYVDAKRREEVFNEEIGLS